MTEKQVVVLALVLSALVVPLSLGLALWLVTRLRRRSDQPPSTGADGETVIPVRGLARHFRLFGRTHNSINPRLALANDGLRFKVFRADHWPFADIVRVDAPWTPFATRLVLRHRREGELWVDLADKTRARDFLHLLPRTIALTQRALALRDATG